jgi:hypothetical protein
MPTPPTPPAPPKPPATAPSPLSPEAARAFAASWYAAWNSRNLDAIMAHYADSIEHSSPFIARYNGTSDPSIRGSAPLREYFARALAANPALQFHPQHLTIGTQTVILIYRRHNGDLAAELFAFDPAGKIVRSISHYDLAPS